MTTKPQLPDLKRRIAAGEPVVAVNVGGANPDILEPLQRFGADLAFIDCERTGIGLDVATDLIRAARACGLPAVVRSWSSDPAVLVQYLDRKADGIVVPHVDDAGQAARIVELVRYACGSSAPQKLVLVQIETRKAVEAIDEMAAVDDVDAFLIGPNDLAYELTGMRGARTPDTEQAIDHVTGRLRAAGRRFGMPGRIEDLAVFRARGCTVLYYPVEWLLERALADLKSALLNA
jgi:2-keto-3-deoxy-L-rhamnonate aldolase RhmA